MKKYFQNYLIYNLIAGSLIFASCSEDPIPLRDPNLTQVEKEYTWEATADSAQTSFYTIYLGSNGTFRANNTGSDNFGYWPNAHALHVLVDAYERTKDASYLPKMKTLVQGIRQRNGGTYSNIFNDDMLWLGNAAARAFKATDDQEYLDVAVFLWNDVLKSDSDVFGGGITWKKDTPKQKNAVSNGPTAVLGLRLYELLGEDQYLDKAKEIYEWEKNNLVDPVTGLVWDNISEENGVVSTNKDWIFTYNIGTWIGASVKLYRATKERQYLENALTSARSMMISPKLTTEGILRDEGQGDGGLFKGILVRYFTELILEPDVNSSDREAFVTFLKFNATTLYDDGLKRPQLIVGPDWRKEPSGSTDLTTQLSGMMLLEASAKLARAKVF